MSKLIHPVTKKPGIHNIRLQFFARLIHPVIKKHINNENHYIAITGSCLCHIAFFSTFRCIFSITLYFCYVFVFLLYLCISATPLCFCCIFDLIFRVLSAPVNYCRGCSLMQISKIPKSVITAPPAIHPAFSLRQHLSTRSPRHDFSIAALKSEPILRFIRLMN